VTADSPGSSTPQHPTEEHSSLAIALIVWLLIQLAAIALAASGVPLSANFPHPPQSLAVHEMLIAQFVGSAMFLSVLFRGGWRAWLGMVLSAGPMLMLAVWVARMPMSRVMLAWGEVALWLTTLALWRAVFSCGNVSDAKARGLQSPRSSSVLSALAILLSAGGLLWWYLRVEARLESDLKLSNFFPLASALHLLDEPANLVPLLSTAVMSAAALVILAAKATLRRAREHRASAQTTHSPT
jgi:hypothetical protein